MNEDDRSCGIISILKRGDEGGGGVHLVKKSRRIWGFGPRASFVCAVGCSTQSVRPPICL